MRCMKEYPGAPDTHADPFSGVPGREQNPTSTPTPHPISGQGVRGVERGKPARVVNPTRSLTDSALGHRSRLLLA